MLARIAAGCLHDDTILEFVEGKLGAGREAAVHDHVAGCRACRRIVAEAAKYHLEEAGGAGTGTEEAPTHQARASTQVDTVFDRPRRQRVEQRRLAPGEAVGRYLVVQELGRGGMGVVYEAYDPQLDRKIALKLLCDAGDSPSEAEELRARLLREAQAMARLSHPNVVAVHDVGTFEHQIYVAMELVRGQTLAEWLRQTRPSRREVLAVFEQAARGLGAAHVAGLVHRDFKPQNVLVGVDGRVKVTDFGLARPTEVDDEVHDGPSGQRALDLTLTRTGVVLGTPAYMAPEQFTGSVADASTDQFSFCVALYEAIYGHRPFLEAHIANLPR